MNNIRNNNAFGLIEVLITTVVLAIGLLGAAIIQQKSMLLSQDNDNSATAAMLIADMANRLNANKKEAEKATLSAYLSLNPHIICDPYISTTCSSNEIAESDLVEWKNLVAQSLPNGVGKICLDSVPANNANSLNCNGVNPGAGNPTYPSIVYTIKIRWTNTKNNNSHIMNQTVIPCPPAGCEQGINSCNSSPDYFCYRYNYCMADTSFCDRPYATCEEFCSGWSGCSGYVSCANGTSFTGTH